MISKNIIKLVRSLEQKKNRRREGLFVAEGPKVVGDMLPHYTVRTIIATDEWVARNALAIQEAGQDVEIVYVNDEELRKVSFLQHPQQVVALLHLPESETDTSEVLSHLRRDLCLTLDGIQDPGNLGTIIRIADWFGISNIICSSDTADAYNPKVVQATMGSLARTNIVYTDLETFLDRCPNDIPIYGTLLDGDNIYESPLTPNGLIIMGNEGNGISQEIRKRISRKLLIPDFHNGETADSLNVAIATAITCSEFRRRSFSVISE